MPRPSEGPKCPTPDEIDQMVDCANSWITYYEKAQNSTQSTKAQSIAVCERLIEILDWAGEQVNKRRLYSKKFQLKDKERTRLLKERLGEDYDVVVEQARRVATSNLFEEVANGTPDRDVHDLLK